MFLNSTFIIICNWEGGGITSLTGVGCLKIIDKFRDFLV